jgi:LysW-gamma-L-lysine carboxypeptidase
MPEQVSDEQAEALLHELVSIPSPSTQEAWASSFLVDWLAEYGFEAHIDYSGSAVGVRGDGPRDVVLLGHIDTFPGEVPVRRVYGRLYGRGAVDAKGSLAAFAVAAARVAPPPGTRWVVVGATEEEAATSRGARHVLTQFSPELCIIGEPSGWDRITLGYKGRLLVDWGWHGPLAHSAAPTPSPAERAVAFWRQVEAYAEEFNQGCGGIFTRLDASLRALNTQTDGTHGSAQMTIGLRLPPGLHPDDAQQALCLRQDGGCLAFRGAEVAFLATKRNPLTRAFLRAIRTQDGQPRFVTKTGTSDMNIVGPVWSCPIVAYGPGDSSLDHTPDEYIELADYQRAIRVLETALMML